MIGFDIKFIKFRNNEDFRLLSNGTIQFDPKYPVNVISAADEGYNIVFAKRYDCYVNHNNSHASLTDSESAKNPLKPSDGIFALIKGYDDTHFSAPVMLYQLTNSNIKILEIKCQVSSIEVGQICMITMRLNANPLLFADLYYLSSGSVTKFTPTILPFQFKKINKRFLSDYPKLYSIPYGGYLYIDYYTSYSDCTNKIHYAYGYTYSKDTGINNWSFLQPSITNASFILILPNNTLLLPQPGSNNSWSFFTADLSRLTEDCDPDFGDRDHDYSNFQVNTTNPQINSTISTSTNNITITYFKPVELSSGNILIYQVEDSGDILRQTVNGIASNNYCSISDDELTVTVKVIKSAFSKPGGKFYIKVDNNFVKDKAHREPLRGITENIWKFNTGKFITPHRYFKY